MDERLRFQNADWAQFRLLSRIASLYYLDEKTQSEIAKDFGLSRQKVQRLLEKARELGIVEIHVHHIPVHHEDQEAKLKEIFGLQDVVVAPVHPDEKRCRLAVARAAALFLGRTLKDGAVVAVGLGRNTSQVAEVFQPTSQIGYTFVSAMGGSPLLGESISPNNIARTFAMRTGGAACSLYAPAYVENVQVRNALYEQDAVRATISLAREADVALVGIGSHSDDSILVQAGCVSQPEIDRLRTVGAVGEVLGNYFDEEGKVIDSSLSTRLVALTFDELQRIPKVIAVASEQGKARAILGALRSGVINSLIIDCRNAVRVLEMAGVNNLDADETMLSSP